MDQERHSKQRHIPIRRIIFWIGISLILLGYVFISASANTFVATAEARVFVGIGMVIGGAILWLGAIFFD
jgi:hypothetical protein